MKKKSLNTLLLIAALSVWGMIIYKLFANNNEIVYKNSKQIIDSENRQIRKIDNYEIEAYSRDPFLSILSDTAEIIAEPKAPAVVKQVKSYNLPQYNGMIIHEKEKTGIFKLNNKCILLSEKQTYENFKIIKFNDSIAIINIDGEQIRIERNKKKTISSNPNKNE